MRATNICLKAFGEFGMEPAFDFNWDKRPGSGIKEK